MQPILAKYTASISELKKSPTKVLKEANNEVVAILKNNITSAYLVPNELYMKMMDIIDDYELSKTVKERLNYNNKDLIEIPLDEL